MVASAGSSRLNKAASAATPAGAVSVMTRGAACEASTTGFSLGALSGDGLQAVKPRRAMAAAADRKCMKSSQNRRVRQGSISRNEQRTTYGRTVSRPSSALAVGDLGHQTDWPDASVPLDWPS